MVNLYKLFAALRQGATLTHASTWANTSAATSALAGLLWAALQLAGALGYALPISPDQLATLSAAMVSIVGVITPVMHIAANPHAGLPPKPGPLEPYDTDGPRTTDNGPTS